MSNAKYPKSIGVRMTHEMYANLKRLAGSDRKVNTLIREAIRLYLDNQADLGGSRRYFTGQFKARVEALERLVGWQLTLLTLLVAEVGSILILALVDLPEDQRPNFSGSALLKIAEERLIESGCRVRQRVMAATNEAELVEQRQLDQGG